MAEYVVDPTGRRIGKKVDGKLVRGWLYENGLRVAAELNAMGDVTSQFVYAAKVNVPDYMVKGGVTYRIITDHLGSPRYVLHSETGAVVQEMNHDETGQVITDTNPEFQPFGFAGGLFDRDVGFVRFGARDYDPEVGRWTAKDPILLQGGVNLYRYSDADPVNLTDPTGEIAYRCEAPPFKMPGIPESINPYQHAYVCVSDESGEMQCDGQMFSGESFWSTFSSPGRAHDGQEYALTPTCEDPHRGSPVLSSF